jgi:hypothetical protein
MKFYVDLGDGESHCVEGDEPGPALKFAEQNAKLTHENIFVRTDKGRAVAIRNWNENLDGIQSQTHPIKVGDGYYADWRMNLVVEVERD